MQSSATTTSPTHTKEFGPLIIALAFVICLGGIVAASIAICGWNHVKSASVNVLSRSAQITCK